MEPTFRSAGAKEGFGLAVTCRLRADGCHGEALQKLSEEDGAWSGQVSLHSRNHFFPPIIKSFNPCIDTGVTRSLISTSLHFLHSGSN